MIYPRILLGDLDLTAAPFAWEFGSDFGGPEIVYETLLSLLRDGSSVSSNRADNRTFTLPVLIEGADFLSLAEYEALLVAECDKPRNTLTFEPGDAFGPPSVFETFRASATLVRNDDEEQAFIRRWSITLQAIPWPRSAEETVTPAQPPVSYTPVDDGSALSGGGFSWEASSSNVTLSIDSGKVKAVGDHDTHSMTVFVRRTGDVDLSAARYVAYDISATVPVETVGLSVNPGALSLTLAAVVDLGGGVKRYFFVVPARVPTPAVNLILSVRGVYGTGTDAFWIDQVQTADALPFLGTARQQILSLVPGGSVRTQGSLAVESPTSALGSALVFSYPAGLGWTPPLRPWRTAGTAPSSDATAASGFSQTLGTATVYAIPASILPQGSYLVMARVKGTAAAHTFTTVTNVAISTTITESVVTLVTETDFANTAYHFETLGRLSLPSARIGPAGYVWISVAADANVTLDEVYLLHESGDLTVVECGTVSPSAGGTSNRLWIDAPSLDDPLGSVWVGYSADRSDARYAGTLASARPPYGHNLDPAGMNVFVVTSNATDAEVSSTHYRRWHTHAAE